jgi:hypothetical protein
MNVRLAARYASSLAAYCAGIYILGAAHITWWRQWVGGWLLYFSGAVVWWVVGNNRKE